MTVHRFIVSFIQQDPRSSGLLADARLLGFADLKSLVCQDLYFVEGLLSEAELSGLGRGLLSDALTQCVAWDTGPAAPERNAVIVEVALRSGVTDPVAAEIARAAHELGFAGVERAATGFRYIIEGADEATADRLARRLLANAVIQRYAVGEIEPSFPSESESSGATETIPLRDLSDDQLLILSKERRAALDLAEMQAIQSYFRSVKRDPTDVEFEMIAQTWSEHCVHKTFKARVTIDHGPRITDGEVVRRPSSVVDSLIKTYLKAATEKISAPWVISAFVDNAGIIEFDDQYEVSFKVETHNHPSAIEPFGGANTGVGGVIRDVLGVSAKPIAATDVLCFGPQDADPNSLPEGVLDPRRVQSGVVAGVQDYGNKIGIPTVNGAILYDAGFTANPLVFCGCVGLAPRSKHVNQPRAGDRVILIGGRTGRDGLRGATFSSMTMDAQTGEVSGASVQIGDPIVEKGLIEVIVRARDLGLYHAITDCGAGGLSSAVGEMTSKTGGEIDLAGVRLKYPGLAPWEIWLSEAQERMVLAVPPENVRALQELCDTFDAELTDIGAFTEDGRITVCYGERTVLQLDNDFLHDGLPQRQLSAVLSAPNTAPRRAGGAPEWPGPFIYGAQLLRLLAHPNIASKAAVVRIYDHEVQGGTVVKPLTGARNDGPSDACVLKPIGTKGTRGIVLSNGINPEYGKVDAYLMAHAVVDEAVRNAAAVGADPARIAILDNFCWGDPLQPETLGTLVEAARGCHDAALRYGTPFISGKDSLNNEYLGADGQRHAIPPTLLISAIGIIEDVSRSVTMDLKEAGNLVYLVGDFAPVFGGAHYNLVTTDPTPTLGAGGGQWTTNAALLRGPLSAVHAPSSVVESIPSIPEHAPAVYRALHTAMGQGIVRACHDLSEGGLAVAAAEMCIGGRLGLSLNLPAGEPTRGLFGETNGCLLVEVRSENAAAFEKLLGGLPLLRLGMVTSQPAFVARNQDRTLFTLPVDELVAAWSTTP